MNLVQKIESWGDTHQTKWLAFFRILLGAVIFFKGLFFISNTGAIDTMISKSAVSIYAVFLTHYVTLVHIMGGLLIAIGLLTRLSVLCQIPVLLGAIIFVNADKGFYSIHSELGLSIIVLALLLFFLVFGSGSYSVDEFMRKHVHT
ncbi:MAG: DoxX family protein [Bacteroidia bacterium]|nr:DoxX family protein [Bacteroidia bacterium]